MTTGGHSGKGGDEPSLNDTPDAQSYDIHASKISPDDPRLKLRAHGTRRLRKGLVLGIVGVLAAAVAASVVVASEPQKRAPSPVAPRVYRPAEVPEAIQKLDSVRPAAPVAPDSAPPNEGVLTERLPVVPLRPLPSDSELPAVPTEDHSPGRKEPEDEGLLAEVGELPEIPMPEVPSHAEMPDRDRPSPASGRERDQLELPDTDPNQQGRKNAFLRSGRLDDDYLEASLEPARSPYEIQAGTIIPAAMVTAINSDLPGTIIARVREEVCDTVSGRYTLIPQNSILKGRYDSMIAWGQERVLFCWDRLALPNGDKIKLGCMPAADLTGQAGLTGEVDEHWWRIVKGAVLASIFSAGISAAGGDTTNYHPTVPQNMAHGAAEEIGRAGEAITRRNLNIQPTIPIPRAAPFNVIVTQDMILKPYRATPCGGDR